MLSISHTVHNIYPATTCNVKWFSVRPSGIFTYPAPPTGQGLLIQFHFELFCALGADDAIKSRFPQALTRTIMEMWTGLLAARLHHQWRVLRNAQQK